MPQEKSPQELVQLGLLTLSGIQSRTEEKIRAYTTNLTSWKGLGPTQLPNALTTLQAQAKHIVADISSLIDCLENIARLGSPAQLALRQDPARLTGILSFIDQTLLKNPALQAPYNLLDSSGEGASRRERLERASVWIRSLLGAHGANGTRIDQRLADSRIEAASVLIKPVNPPNSPNSPNRPTSALPDLSIGSANAAHSQLNPQTPQPPQTRADLEKPFHDAVEKDGFEIVRELGRGGMGVVYIAKESGTGRMVALKRILYAGGEEILRFKREATAVAKLTEKIKGLGLLQLFRFQQMENGDWIQVMELEKGPTAGKIDSSTLGAVLMEGSEDPEASYILLRTAAKRLQSSSADKKSFPRNELTCLVEFFVATGQVKPDTEEHEALARLSAQLRTGENPAARKDFADDLTALKKLVKTCPALTKDDAKTRTKREKDYEEPRATLQDLFELEDLHPEEAVTGSKAKTIFKVLRESCGEDFPEAEMLEFWGHFVLGFSRTMQAVEAEGVHHRDLKPANLLISDKAAEIMCELTDSLMQATKEPQDAKRQKKMKGIAQKAVEKIKSVAVPLKIIDFGIVKSPDEREAAAVRSMSGEQAPRAAAPGGETSDLTVNGQTLGTIAYMTPQSLSGMANDPRRDLHAGIQSMWEIYGSEKFTVGPNIATIQMGRILSRARNADAARAEKNSKKKSRTKNQDTPTALIDVNTKLVAVLESTQPQLLDISRRATYLTAEENAEFPEASWEELTKILEAWLLPKPLSKRTIAGGAVVLVAALSAIGGGFWKWDQRRKLEAEAQRITASIDAEIENIDLMNPMFDSQYFSRRLEEIRRVEEVYGEEMDPELRQKTERYKRRYEFYQMAASFLAACDNWPLHETPVKENPETLRQLRQAAQEATTVCRFLEANWTNPRSTQRNSNRIDDRYIRPSSTDANIANFVSTIVPAFEDPERLRNTDWINNMCEFLSRTMEVSRDQNLADHIETIERESLFRTARWLAIVFHVDCRSHPEFIFNLTPETQLQIVDTLVKVVQYHYELEMVLSSNDQNPNSQLKTNNRQALCASLHALFRIERIIRQRVFILRSSEAQ